jgi:hypothetical protein
MAYIINKTDGTILTTVPDGQIDSLSSDLTLIGKNFSGFGESLNENLVKLLENFANSTSPARPIRGQMWFDTTENKLKVYTGTGFVPVSSATISTFQPTSLGIGDLWYNSTDKQLYFFDGVSPILLGPDYSESQGLSGFRVSTILDQTNVRRVITSLYNNGTLIGIFSKDRFTPKIPIVGFNDDTGLAKIIEPGFNAGYLGGLKFVVTAENSLKLDGTEAVKFARQDQANIFTEQLAVKADAGILFGTGLQSVIDVAAGTTRITNNASNRNLEIKVRKDADSETAVNVLSSTREIKLYEGFLDSAVITGGNLEVKGNITVRGKLTVRDEVLTERVTELSIEDKVILLADTGDANLNTDVNADGGGIILQGDNPHKITWSKDRASWESTENWNLDDGKEYRIGGVAVLSATSLGSTITSIPGVTSFGTQTTINIGPLIPPNPAPTPYLRLENNRISTLQTDQSLEIEPNGQGNVELIGSPKILGLSTTNDIVPSQTSERTNPQGPIPALSDSELSEAANKKYTLNFVRRRSIVLSLDITDSPTNAAIASILTQLAPPAEYENGTIARILCSSLTNSTTSLNINSLLVKNNTVEYNTPTGTGFPLQDVAISNATISAPSISVFRIVKTFELQAGAWAFIS